MGGERGRGEEEERKRDIERRNRDKKRREGRWIVEGVEKDGQRKKRERQRKKKNENERGMGGRDSRRVGWTHRWMNSYRWMSDCLDGWLDI